jgi:hypothetical protein
MPESSLCVKQRTEPAPLPWQSGTRLVNKEANMADDLSNRGQQDRSRINLSEKWEVQYWTKELGVSEDELRQIIQQAGNNVTDVRQHLKR